MSINGTESNSSANRMMYLFMATGIVPLLVIFAIYLYNPGSQVLYYIASGVSDLPAVTSLANPLMTKVMDAYCKTAPFLAFALFIFSFKKRKVLEMGDKKKLAISCFFSPLLYAFFIYMFLFRDMELTTAGRPVKYLSNNDFTLLLFYSGLYYASFLLTYGICYIPVITYKSFKVRQ